MQTMGKEFVMNRAANRSSLIGKAGAADCRPSSSTSWDRNKRNLSNRSVPDQTPKKQRPEGQAKGRPKTVTPKSEVQKRL